jgi:hypothetical protein
MDQQSFLEEGTRTYSNTALQNNTAPGARGQDNTHSYSSVLVDTEASREPNIADALIYAHKLSLNQGTVVKINVINPRMKTKDSGPMSPTGTFICNQCGFCKCLPIDLIERSLALAGIRGEGSYPPDHTCPRCKKGKLVQQQ